MTQAAAMRAARVPLTVAMLVGLMAHSAMADAVRGTATYRERMALPSAAVFEAVLEDASRGDGAAETIARTRVASPGTPPIRFSIEYDPGRILVDHLYVVRARILVDERVLFTTDAPPAVITRGSPTRIAIVLRKISSVRPKRTGGKSLEGTYWKAIELAGRPVPALAASREAHLLFQPGGRVSGVDGCNRITGGYQLKKDAVTFGEIARTRMACMDSAEVEDGFRDALQNARRLTIASDRLELADAAGNRLAVFTAVTETSSPRP